jgi:nucleoside-diphosphate-sugar epimerase
MKLVLTGASGFLGAPCLKRLLERGHHVLTLSRRPKQRDPKTGSGGVEWLYADLNDPSSYRDALAAFQPEAALHLAWEGIPDFSLQNSLRNLQNGALFAATALELGCRHLVTSGSCWEYGKLRGPVRETDHPLEPGIFGASKNSQRLILRSLAQQTGASMAWARVFYPYGPGQRAASLVPGICRALRAQKTPVLRTPAAASDFLYYEDVVSALVLLLECRADGVFNVGSGTATTAGHIADTLLCLAGCPPRFADSALHPEPFFFADTSAIRSVGWEPAVDLREGLRRTWDWYLENSGL